MGGSGPFHRYVDHLRQLGFDVNGIIMTKTSRTFHFGGDHSTTSHWIARIPLFINNSFGYIQSFIISGETPMLLGRPVIESLGLVINFKRMQEEVFLGSDAPASLPGERNIFNKHWKMLETALVTEEKRVQATVTRELNDPEGKPRVIWEVYAGES